MQTYHYILTTLKSTGSGATGYDTYIGIVTRPDGVTREEVFREIYRRVTGRDVEGHTSPVTLFFSLEPNTLES